MRDQHHFRDDEHFEPDWLPGEAQNGSGVVLLAVLMIGAILGTASVVFAFWVFS